MNGIKMKGYSNYWIFPQLGMIWSIPRERTRGGWIGSPNESRGGYWRVGLIDDNGEQKKFLLARLIWESVNGKIPENMEINHKTENKDMNMISCLELVDRKTNINYGTRNARRAEKQRNDPNKSKQVAAYQNGVLVMTFPSTAEAQRQGYDSGNVSRCCRGEQQTHKGYQWLYYVDSPPLFYISA